MKAFVGYFHVDRIEYKIIEYLLYISDIKSSRKCTVLDRSVYDEQVEVVGVRVEIGGLRRIRVEACERAREHVARGGHVGRHNADSSVANDRRIGIVVVGAHAIGRVAGRVRADVGLIVAHALVGGERDAYPGGFDRRLGHLDHGGERGRRRVDNVPFEHHAALGAGAVGRIREAAIGGAAA